MNTHAVTIDDLERWVLSGAQWRVVDISREHAVVEMCSCMGEPMERVESHDPAVIGYLRTARAWLQQSSDSTAAYARTRELLAVRSARAGARISGPRRVRRGRPAQFRFAGHSELPRWLEIDLNPVGGGRCDSAPKLGSSPLLLTRLAEGDFRLGARAPHRLIARPGRYRLCAWVIEGVLDQRPEAAASYAFRVTAGR